MNEQIKNMKHEYECMKASDTLKKEVHEIIKRGKRNTAVKFAVSTAASLIVIFSISINISPSLAYTIEKIPALKPIVYVLTFGRYESHQNGYEADITTPQIEGLLDKKLQDRLNDQFKGNAKTLITAFQKDVKKFSKENPTHQSIQANYEVKTNDDAYLSLDCYTLKTAADSFTVHSFYTIDKKTGHLLSLRDLFKKDADYVTVLSDYIRREMIRQNQEEGAMFFTEDEPDYQVEGFKKIRKDQNFYMNHDGNLVICFDQFEVAAGAQGSPEFVIPKNIIANITK